MFERCTCRPAPVFSILNSVFAIRYSSGQRRYFNEAMKSRYTSALRFGVRFCVAKSTCTMPKRFVNPWLHSRLSSSDQTK